ncbi:TetR/AcrR family transcriptional regulator [Antrihabitans stalactiti]
MTSGNMPPNKHQEKSLRTRALLLDAAIDSLVDVGYGKASIADIAARAGVTRGAQVHHFRTRTELFAHVIEHLAERQTEAVQDRAAALPPSTTPAEIVVELVSAAFSGELGKASMELFTSVGGEDDLRDNMLRAQRELTNGLLETCARLIGSDVATDRLETTFWLTINLVRGTTIDEMLRGADRRRKLMLAEWTSLAAVSLRSP